MEIAKEQLEELREIALKGMDEMYITGLKHALALISISKGNIKIAEGFIKCSIEKKKGEMKEVV